MVAAACTVVQSTSVLKPLCWWWWFDSLQLDGSRGILSSLYVCDEVD